MKKLFLILTIGIVFVMPAQRDSTRKFRVSGVQSNFGVIYSGPYKSLTSDEYKSFVKDDPLLNRDYSAYQSSSYYGAQFMPGFSVRAFVDLKQRGKRGSEFFFGIKICGEYLSSLSYNRSETEILDIYYSQSGQAPLHKIRETQYYSSFDLQSTHTYLQLGYNLSTSKQRWIWFTAGIELSPGISYNFKYSSSESIHTIDAIILSGDSVVRDFWDYNYSSQTFQGTASTKSLSGIGFAMYSSLPFSLNVRFGKKIKIVKNMNFSATMGPVARASSDRFTGSSFKFGFNADLGLRINW